MEKPIPHIPLFRSFSFSRLNDPNQIPNFLAISKIMILLLFRNNTFTQSTFSSVLFVHVPRIWHLQLKSHHLHTSKSTQKLEFFPFSAVHKLL
jgi:hypothetical protein